MVPVLSKAEEYKPRLAICFHAGFLLGLFDPEDGGGMFLRNVS
jgi:hypothetical protein